MLNSLIIAATLLGGALSAPTIKRDTVRKINTGMMALRSASPIHFGTINATQNEFWIGKETTTSCPYNPPYQECNYENGTVVTISPDEPRYQVYMNANVRGGQNVYVAQDGALKFTAPQREYNFPDGSYPQGFVYERLENNISLLKFTNGSATSWFACPAEANKVPTDYKIFANVVGWNNDAVPTKNTSDCLGFGMTVLNEEDSLKDIAAWQYV